MTVQHCPGCRGYTRDWQRECPGIAMASPLSGEVSVVDAVPPLGFRDRLRVLAGRPVFLGVQAGISDAGGMDGLTCWEDWRDAI